MRRLLASALATAAVAACATAVTAPAAHADPAAISSVSVKPALAVQTKVNKQKINVEVRTSTGVDSVTADLQARVGDGQMFVILKEVQPGVWQGWDYLYNWEAAGTWTADIEASDYDSDAGDAKKTSSFQVRRGTYVSGFKASPGKVRKGKAISVSGSLKGLGSYGEYYGLKKGKVVVYFKRKGTKSWVKYGTVTTGSGGKFLKKFKAKTSGYWLARFDGTGYWYRSYSAGKGVVVR